MVLRNCITFTVLLLAFYLNAQEDIKDELLNGIWLQACDSILAGEYAGEIECSIELHTQVSFEIKRNKVIMVRNDILVAEIDTFNIFIKEIGDASYLIGSTKNEPWVRKIHKIHQDKLEIYSEGGSFITRYLK